MLHIPYPLPLWGPQTLYYNFRKIASKAPNLFSPHFFSHKNFAFWLKFEKLV